MAVNDPYDYDMTTGEEPEPILGSYEIPKEVLEAKPKKDIPWAVIGIAVAGVAVVALLIFGVTKIVAGARGGKNAKAEGTALSDMLSDAGDELASMYGIDVSDKKSKKKKDPMEGVDDDSVWAQFPDYEEYEDDTEESVEPAEEASAEGHVVVDVDTEALADQFSGEVEEKANDRFALEVPDSWLGSVSGESDNTRSGSFSDVDNGHKGKITFLVDFEEKCDESDVEEKLNYLRDKYGAEDISEIKLPDTTLYGVEYDDEHLDGSKFAKRQYYGIYNGDLINIFIDSRDTSTDVFNDPSLWAMVYSFTLK